MNCKQAWDLMMKHYDNNSEPYGPERLSDHLDKCSLCKEKFESLNDAFTVMKDLSEAAPSDIEKNVMEKLEAVKQERDYLIPYVAVNLIIFVSIIVFWLEKIFRTGIASFIGDIFSKILVAYNTSAVVITAYQSFLSNFLLKQAAIVILIACSIIGILSLIPVFRKIRNKQYSGMKAERE